MSIFQPPSVRFRELLNRRTTTLHTLERLASKLDDIRNVDPFTKETSLALAAKSGRIDVFCWLLEEGHEEGKVSRDVNGLTILHTSDNIDVLEVYTDMYPFVLNWVSNQGSTPLHSAAQHGSYEAAQFFLENGVDINAPDLDGNTPLHIAASWGHNHVAKLLIDSGCEVLRNAEGFEAAQYAYSFAKMKEIEDLLKARTKSRQRTKSPGKSKKFSEKEQRRPSIPLSISLQSLPNSNPSSPHTPNPPSPSTKRQSFPVSSSQRSISNPDCVPETNSPVRMGTIRSVSMGDYLPEIYKKPADHMTGEHTLRPSIKKGYSETSVFSETHESLDNRNSIDISRDHAAPLVSKQAYDSSTITSKVDHNNTNAPTTNWIQQEKPNVLTKNKRRSGLFGYTGDQENLSTREKVARFLGRR